MYIRCWRKRYQASAIALLLVTAVLVQPGCFTETGQNYYGLIVVPRAQEFRWSNGGLPRIFDPAFAAAPPDTDLVRAIFEGLTDYDPRSLTPIPAVATRWEPSEDGLVWTFYLRPDARWSNGEAVTAADFVRSWQRTVKMGQLAPHTELLKNIAGVRPNSLSTALKAPVASEGIKQVQEFGASAVGEHVLRVRLEHPDMSFPALVAHPVFRPVKVADEEHTAELTDKDLVSNGAFALAPNVDDKVLLERADYYWDKDAVSLQRVEFVDVMSAEEALTAYREGEIDALTNAAFEPLALKLLAPYKDFRRETYGALNYYCFNTQQEPFNDVRVREALAIAIDRERVSQDNLGGATEPAKRFLPQAITAFQQPVVDKSELLEQDVDRARKLLEEAGFPDGEGFPTVRLLINRNEQQRVVARSIAAMWRRLLNIETEIILKNWDEYEAAIRAGDYDLVRRGLVMQTTDEFANIRMMFRHEQLHSTLESEALSASGERRNPAVLSPMESEAQALQELRAIPIYFASSYALVKPYVDGFDSNVLDIASLKHVRINTTWKEPKH